MNTKKKIAVDLTMLLTLFILMSYMYTEQMIHEWAGTVMFLLFLAHTILNYRWYQMLSKGKWKFFRIAQTLVNLGVLVCIVILMLSGMIMSRYVFGVLDLHSYTSLARVAHLLCSYWMFVLSSIHFGLHIPMMIQRSQRRIPILQMQSIRLGMKLLSVVLIVLGIYFFLQQNLLSYMFLKSQFVFWDYDKPLHLFLLEYFLIMYMAATLGFGITILNKRGKTL